MSCSNFGVEPAFTWLANAKIDFLIIFNRFSVLFRYFIYHTGNQRVFFKTKNLIFTFSLKKSKFFPMPVIRGTLNLLKGGPLQVMQAQLIKLSQKLNFG